MKHLRNWNRLYETSSEYSEYPYSGAFPQYSAVHLEELLHSINENWYEDNNLVQEVKKLIKSYPENNCSAGTIDIEEEEIPIISGFYKKHGRIMANEWIIFCKDVDMIYGY